MDEQQINEEQSTVTAENAACSAENEGEGKYSKLSEAYEKLQQQYDSLQKKNIVEKICAETGCADPEYLEFCACRRGVDVTDPEALRHFAGELASSSPGCFRARIIPGSNAGNSTLNSSVAAEKTEVLTGDRIGLIAMSISSAPDAVCR